MNNSDITCEINLSPAENMDTIHAVWDLDSVTFRTPL
jgi:hypothetical protein